jgi:bacillopeptidase F (M6 metalloprotease family)
MKGILPEKIRTRQDKADVRKSYIRGLKKYEEEKLKKFAKKCKKEDTPISKYLEAKNISYLSDKMSKGELSKYEEEPERVLLWRSLALDDWLSKQNDTGPQSAEYETI